MAKRLTYRPKPKHVPETRRQAGLEARADHLLNFGHLHVHEGDPEPERSYYRSVGSVLQKEGKWFACDGTGQIVGEFKERWQAWQHADKYGMERAGALE